MKKINLLIPPNKIFCAVTKMQQHVYASIGAGVAVLVGALVAARTFQDESLWKTGDGADPANKKRETRRGLVASIGSGVVVMIIMQLLQRTGAAHPLTMHTLLSIVWGNLCAFLADKGL